MGNARSTNSGRLVDYGFFVALLAAGYLFYRTLESVLVPTVLGAFAVWPIKAVK